MERADKPDVLEADAAFVLKGEHHCHECGASTQVFGLMLVGPFKGRTDVFSPDDGDDIAPLLRRATEIPQPLAEILDAKSSGSFHVDFSHTVGEKYWMNHCSHCGAKIGDWFVHKPGEAFFPTCDAEIAIISGSRVQGPWTFENPELSVSSWTTLWLHLPGNVLSQSLQGLPRPV